MKISCWDSFPPQGFTHDFQSYCDYLPTSRTNWTQGVFFAAQYINSFNNCSLTPDRIVIESVSIEVSIQVGLYFPGNYLPSDCEFQNKERKEKTKVCTGRSSSGRVGSLITYVKWKWRTLAGSQDSRNKIRWGKNVLAAKDILKGNI